MDFFQRQDTARKKTKWLLVYFILGVLLTGIVIYIGFVFLFLRSRYNPNSLLWMWDPSLFAGVFLGTLAVILTGSFSKMMQLRAGGRAVALSLDGQPVDMTPQDVDLLKLRNVVEEMSIASGTPVPEIYILPKEAGINAFAAGHDLKDAAIGVTQGCVRHLNRDELQGVIAHEFSHILNGDMKLNLRLVGLVHGLLCLAIIGRVLLRTGSRHTAYRLGARKKGGNPLPAVGLVLFVVGSIGVFFGHLIKSAVSRQREFLADASAVQFTRNPDGLANALKKIGGLTYGSRLGSAHAEEASHMFFGNGMGKSLSGMLATHPPLEERIKAIDPAFDGVFPTIESDPFPPPLPTHVTPPLPPSPRGLPPLPEGAAQVAPLLNLMTAAELMDQVGTLRSEHLQKAREFLLRLPPDINHAAHDPLPATGLVYLLLLSPQEPLRTGQKARLLGELDSSMKETVSKLDLSLQSLPETDKIPLVDLLIPALRRLSPADYGQFNQRMDALIAADEQLDVFEYALRKMIQRHVQPAFAPPAKEIIQYYSVTPLLRDCAILLSALAHTGHGDEAESQKAFQSGWNFLPHVKTSQGLIPLDTCTLERLDQALNRLNASVPQIKKNVLAACARTVAADRQMTVQEFELLRAISDALGCPLPLGT